MVDKLEELVYTKRVEIDITEAEEVGVTRLETAEFDLNLSLDEIAEIVALQFSFGRRDMIGDVDIVGHQACAFLVLDPDEAGWGGLGVGDCETDNDCLWYGEVYGWWKNVAGAQEAGQSAWSIGMVHFPTGIYTTVNPVVGVGRGGGGKVSAEGNFCLYYRVRKPSTNDLGVLVARRR